MYWMNNFDSNINNNEFNDHDVFMIELDIGNRYLK